MRTMALWLVFTLAPVCLARASEDNGQLERQTLEAARLLAGRSGRLPIALASVLPDGASSRGIEGWTIPRADGKGEQIFVYTASEIFRCASKGKNYQCLLRLASIIVHEAWHFRNGGSEDGAYAAQIAFLMGNQGAPEQIAAVRMARDRVLAAERKAIETAKKRGRDQSRRSVCRFAWVAALEGRAGGEPSVPRRSRISPCASDRHAPVQPRARRLPLASDRRLRQRQDAATSLPDKPPKYRSSTICACRGSRRLN